MSEGRRLKKEFELPATPEQVWEAIATGPGLTNWFAPMEVEPRVGGSSSLGTVTAWEPGKRFATDSFEFLIEARDGGTTVLRFVHSGFDGEDWEAEYDNFDKGWNMYFQTLVQYFTLFPGRSATYVQASGPPASGRESAWGVLLGGLGLTGQVGEGDEARLPAHGKVAVDGVVDYLDPPFFLGVRTADGLYRFHLGGARTGAPLAAGHYVYSALDSGEAQKSWQSWLDRLFTEPA
jgi:uncharacterized protein YndB with AHSA1/START domain